MSNRIHPYASAAPTVRQRNRRPDHGRGTRMPTTPLARSFPSEPQRRGTTPAGTRSARTSTAKVPAPGRGISNRHSRAAGRVPLAFGKATHSGSRTVRSVTTCAQVSARSVSTTSAVPSGSKSSSDAWTAAPTSPPMMAGRGCQRSRPSRPGILRSRVQLSVTAKFPSAAAFATSQVAPPLAFTPNVNSTRSGRISVTLSRTAGSLHCWPYRIRTWPRSPRPRRAETPADSISNSLRGLIHPIGNHLRRHRLPLSPPGDSAPSPSS